MDRNDYIIALGLGLLSFLLYWRTLVPGLLPNDGSEFQVLAVTLDHAHTTGYEVYTLFARLFTLLVPWGDIAYRVNLFSAFCGSITVALVYLAGKTLSGSRWGASLGAISLAVAATFWSQAIIAEVYTAGSVFTTAVLMCVLLWYRTQKGTFLFLAGLLGGLGINVHGSNILFAPAVLLLILLVKPGWKKSWLPAMVGTVAGIALVIASFAVVDLHESNASVFNSTYLPSISRWDMTAGDLGTFWGRFAFLAFARQWRSAMFVDPGQVMANNSKNFLYAIQDDFSLPILLLMVIGLVVLFFRDIRLGVFFLVAIFVHIIYTFNYRIGDIYVFYLSLYVYLAMLVAIGVGLLLTQLRHLPEKTNRFTYPASALVLIALAVWPIFSQRIYALEAGELRFAFMDLPSNQQLEAWHQGISATVQQLPPDAVVLMDWYNLYGYFYAAQIEQGRTGMQFIEAYPYATKSGMAESLLVYIKQEIQDGRPVYTLNRLGELQRGDFVLVNRPIGATQMFSVEFR